MQFYNSGLAKEASFFSCQLCVCVTPTAVFQGVMEEEGVLTGDNAFNAHFGECITAIGDIDDDGYQGQSKQFTLCPLVCLRWGFSNASHGL